MVSLRGEAVKSQLSGSKEQVGAAGLDLSVMGVMNMGGPGENFQGEIGENGAPPDQAGFAPSGQRNEMPQTSDPANPASPDQTGGRTDQAQGGEGDGTGEQNHDLPQMPDGKALQGKLPQMPNGGPNAGGGAMPENFAPPGETEQSSDGIPLETLALYGGCAVLLLFALVFAKCYRRKNIPAVSKKKQ